MYLLPNNKGVWLDYLGEARANKAEAAEWSIQAEWKPLDGERELNRKRGISDGLEHQFWLNHRHIQEDKWWGEQGFSVFTPR